MSARRRNSSMHKRGPGVVRSAIAALVGVLLASLGLAVATSSPAAASHAAPAVSVVGVADGRVILDIERSGSFPTISADPPAAVSTDIIDYSGGVFRTVVTGLDNDVTYSLSVRTVRFGPFGAGEVSDPTVVTVAPTACCIASAPAGLAAASAASGIVLNWNAPLDDGGASTRYRYEVSAPGAGTVSIDATTGPFSTTLGYGFFQSMTFGEPVTISVVLITEFGRGLVAELVTTVPATTAPTPPGVGTVTVLDEAAGQVNALFAGAADFNPLTDSVYSYRAVPRAPDDALPTIYGEYRENVTPSSVRAIVRGLVDGVSYDMTADVYRYVDGVSLSTTMTPAGATPTSCCVPSEVLNLTVAATDSQHVQLGFDQPLNLNGRTLEGYRVSRVGAGAYSDSFDTSPTATASFYDNFAPGEVVDFEVQARTVEGLLGAPQTITVTFPGLPVIKRANGTALPTEVAAGASFQVALFASDGTGPLYADWDLDGDGSYENDGEVMLVSAITPPLTIHAYRNGQTTAHTFAPLEQSNVSIVDADGNVPVGPILEGPPPLNLHTVLDGVTGFIRWTVTNGFLYAPSSGQFGQVVFGPNVYASPTDGGPGQVMTLAAEVIDPVTFGVVGSQTLSFVVDNVNPAFAAVAPISVPSGKQFVPPSASDVAADPVEYRLDCGTGSFDDWGPYRFCTAPTAQGSYSVVVEARDKDGGFATVLVPLTVTAPNQPPVIEFGTDRDGNEVNYLVLRYSYVATVDPYVQMPLRVTDPEGRQPSVDVTFEPTTAGCTYGYPNFFSSEKVVYCFDNGPLPNNTVTMTVTASDGYDTSTASVDLTIHNVAPTVGAQSGSSLDVLDVGELMPYSWAMSDQGQTDAAQAMCDVAWGDGTVSLFSRGIYYYERCNTSHAYAAPGDYSVVVTATDPDGATATSTSTSTVHVRAGGNHAPIANPDQVVVLAGTESTVRPADPCMWFAYTACSRHRRSASTSCRRSPAECMTSFTKFRTIG
jgi:hypothetical protein